MTSTQINFDNSFSHLRSEHIVPQILCPDGVTTLAVAVAPCLVFPALIITKIVGSNNWWVSYMTQIVREIFMNLFICELVSAVGPRNDLIAVVAFKGISSHTWRVGTYGDLERFGLEKAVRQTDRCPQVPAHFIVRERHSTVGLSGYWIKSNCKKHFL